MAKYLAVQILRGTLDYDAVIARYPSLKIEVDTELERRDNPTE